MKYRVEIKETRTLVFEIEANSPDEADELAMDSEEFISDSFDERVFHSHAVPVSESITSPAAKGEG